MGGAAEAGYGARPLHTCAIIAQLIISEVLVKLGLFVIGLLFAASTAGIGQPPGAIVGPRIIVTGEGEVRVTPDRAIVYVGVQTRAPSAAAAASDNASRQRAIIDAIKALGVTADLISTVNYNVHPEMQYDQQGRVSRIVAYVVTNTVRVELRRIDQVAAVIDAGLGKGANQINGVEFSVSNAEEARRTALAQAITKARADAEAMARAAGGRLGDLIELSSAAQTNYPRPMYDMARMQTSAAAPPTPIEPGQATISASVSAIWGFVK
jgi:uncharacterized protein YggE